MHMSEGNVTDKNSRSTSDDVQKIGRKHKATFSSPSGITTKRAPSNAFRS